MCIHSRICGHFIGLLSSVSPPWLDRSRKAFKKGHKNCRFDLPGGGGEGSKNAARGAAAAVICHSLYSFSPFSVARVREADALDGERRGPRHFQTQNLHTLLSSETIFPPPHICNCHSLCCSSVSHRLSDVCCVCVASLLLDFRVDDVNARWC